MGGCGKASGGPSWSVTAGVVGGVGDSGEWKLTISGPFTKAAITAWETCKPCATTLVTGESRRRRTLPFRATGPTATLPGVLSAPYLTT